MNLIFVHGRSQQGRSSALIRTEWVSALNRGLRDADMVKLMQEPSVPFFGDELDRLAAATQRLPAEDALERAPADVNYRAFLAEFAEEASRRTPVNDEQLERHGFRPTKKTATPNLGRHGDRATRSPDREERGPQNWFWVQAVIRSLDERFPDITEGSLSLILRDVYLYLTNDKVASKIDKIFADALERGPTLVVAHSLGTVVAYNVLQSANVQVARYVTVGSPLAIHAVKQRLRVRPSMPPCVRDWYNARDPADVVALNPLTYSNFATSPPIRNEDRIYNSSDNRHHISQYLNDRRIARAVGELLE